MKNFISILLIISLMPHLLCGCGKNDINQTTSFSTEAKTSEATEMAVRCAGMCSCANCGKCGCSCICQPGNCNCRFVPDMEEINSVDVLNDFFAF